MSRLSHIHLSARAMRYAAVAALAFSLGTASVAAAGPAISGLVGLVDGANTAAINASRELSTADATSHSALATANASLTSANAHLANIDSSAHFTYDAGGNLKTAPQGAQTISGTVNVANLPATQPVSGSVNVSNLPSARQPIQSEKILSSGGTFTCDTIYTVPAGKRLTIDYVNVWAFGLTAGNSAGVRLGGTSTMVDLNIPMNKVFGGDYVGSEMIRFFSTTNFTACATFAVAQGAFAASLEVSWSGSLEDLP